MVFTSYARWLRVQEKEKFVSRTKKKSKVFPALFLSSLRGQKRVGSIGVLRHPNGVTCDLRQKGDDNMFEVATSYMIQLVDLLPGVIAIWLLFDLLGGLFFGKR